MNIRKIIVPVFLSIVVLSCNFSKKINYRLSENEISHFDSLFTAWKQNWFTNSQTKISSNTNDGKKLEEYPQLIAMGEKIIPLVITKLIVEDNFFALPLYDDLQEDDRIKSKNTIGGEQGRARETVVNYMNAKLKEEQINKDELERLKATLPYVIEKGDSVTTLGFIPHAQIFSLDMKRKNADIYLYLLEESKKSDVPVKVYLFPATNNVAFVEIASKEEIKQYEQSRLTDI